MASVDHQACQDTQECLENRENVGLLVLLEYKVHQVGLVVVAHVAQFQC